MTFISDTDLYRLIGTKISEFFKEADQHEQNT